MIHRKNLKIHRDNTISSTICLYLSVVLTINILLKYWLLNRTVSEHSYLNFNKLFYKTYDFTMYWYVWIMYYWSRTLATETLVEHMYRFTALSSHSLSAQYNVIIYVWQNYLKAYLCGLPFKRISTSVLFWHTTSVDLTISTINTNLQYLITK